MDNTSFRTARRAGLAVTFLVATCGLALAGPGGSPHGGGGFGGGFHGGSGFGGGFHGGGFSHGEFGTMHNGGFGQRYSGHSTFAHSPHGSGMSRTAMHHSGSHHVAMGSSHHTHVANNGTPKGFNHGNASWKQNGGTPPGWSHGKKTGWGCTPGSKGCMPPGLAKKEDKPASHTGTTSPRSHPRVDSHSGPTPASYNARPDSRTPGKPQPDSRTPGKSHSNDAPQ